MLYVRSLTALVLGALALAAPAARAQDAPADTAKTRRVTLRDGRTLVGRIAGETAEGVTVVDASGVRTTVPRDQIRRVSAPVTSRFARQDPNYTRLYFAPTARTLGQRSGRVTTYFFVMPSVAYGITDRVDVSGAAILPFDGATFVTANVKAGLVQTSRLSLAVGASAGVPFGADVDGTPVGGTFYGLATFGASEGAVTLGAFGVYGGGFEDEFEVGSGGAILLGAERQISNSVKLISENFLLFASGEDFGSATGHALGLRFFGDRIAADLALLAGQAGGDVEVLPVPYVSFAYNFGR